MNTQRLKFALICSVLLNLGVAAAVAWRFWSPPDFPGLPRHLGLDAAQTARWHAAETEFLAQLGRDAEAIAGHRAALVRAIFAAPPDLAAIETARSAIASLHDAQQRRVVEQLLRERSLLRPDQQARLQALLLDQSAAPASVERLHRP